MPARRRRRLGADRLYVTSADGLPLGHLDLFSRVAHDVPAGYRETFVKEANAWLWQNNMPPMGSPSEVAPEPPPALGAGVEPPEGGWDPGVDDLALRRPGHGLLDEAAQARATRGPDADRPLRLRADGQHAVAEALGKLTRPPALRRGRGARWRDPPPGADGVRRGRRRPRPRRRRAARPVRHRGRQHPLAAGWSWRTTSSTSPAPRWTWSDTVASARRPPTGCRSRSPAPRGPPRRSTRPRCTPSSPSSARSSPATGAHRGVTVTRVGQLPRLLTAFGDPLSDLAVAQTYEVARRSVTWSP